MHKRTGNHANRIETRGRYEDITSKEAAGEHLIYWDFGWHNVCLR